MPRNARVHRCKCVFHACAQNCSVVDRQCSGLGDPFTRATFRAPSAQLLTLVSYPSFREALAGDARWETTRDDDGAGSLRYHERVSTLSSIRIFFRIFRRIQFAHILGVLAPCALASRARVSRRESLQQARKPGGARRRASLHFRQHDARRESSSLRKN